MKKFFRIVIILFLFLIVFSVIAYFYYSDIVKHPLNTKGNIEFKVNNGDNINSVLKYLDEKKFVKNIFITKYYIKNNKLNINIKPGNYSFNENTSITQMVQDLNNGKFDDTIVSVTIPEGFTIEEIAIRLQDKGVLQKDAFLQGCKDYQLSTDIKTTPNRKYALEGYLFPDTYEMKKGMAAKDVIKLMLNKFNLVLNELEQKSNKVLDKDAKDNLVIMASLVEGEAEEKDERAIISGVFYNRLKLGMKLESCASVEYVLPEHKVVLSNKDIKINSPFNTYMVKALPEGPICCPGKAALEAAFSPQANKFLYFVAKFDGTNGHYFSTSLAQHNTATKVSEANMKKNGIK